MHFISQSPFKKIILSFFRFPCSTILTFPFFTFTQFPPFPFHPYTVFPFQSCYFSLTVSLFPLSIFCLLLYAHHMSFSFCQFSFYLFFFCALAFVLGIYFFVVMPAASLLVKHVYNRTSGAEQWKVNRDVVTCRM